MMMMMALMTMKKNLNFYDIVGVGQTHHLVAEAQSMFLLACSFVLNVVHGDGDLGVVGDDGDVVSV